jgi:Beta/Gamma crystallin
MNFTSQTQTRKAPFQNLDAVSALKELPDEAAATCGGGASITLFDNDNYNVDNGYTIRNESDRDLRTGIFKGWEDRTSSIVVNSGTWRVYDKRDFDDSGWHTDLKEGRYTLTDLKKRGMQNDTISSIRIV